MDKNIQVGDKVEIIERIPAESGRQWITKRFTVIIMQITRRWIRVQYPAGYMRCFQWIDWRSIVNASK